MHTPCIRYTTSSACGRWVCHTPHVIFGGVGGDYPCEICGVNITIRGWCEPQQTSYSCSPAGTEPPVRMQRGLTPERAIRTASRCPDLSWLPDTPPAHLRAPPRASDAPVPLAAQPAQLASQLASQLDASVASTSATSATEADVEAVSKRASADNKSRDLNELWEHFMQEARSQLPPPTLELAHEPIGGSLSTEQLRQAPPVLATSVHAQRELESQAAYIAELETMLINSGLSGAAAAGAAAGTTAARGAGAAGATGATGAAGAAGEVGTSTGGAPRKALSGEALALRQENRMLRAKVFQLEQQLQQAHTRCRRAEEVNAQWRSHQTGQRKQYKDQTKQLQLASARLSQLDEVVAQRDGLRELLRHGRGGALGVGVSVGVGVG